MSKVLVTGGAGFIGSHLCDRLVEQEDEVLIFEDFSTGSRKNIAHLAGRVQVIEDSILNICAHREVLSGVTHVYHLAALISGHDSLLDPEPYLEVNVKGVLRLMEVAQTLPGVRIVFASSSAVYGNNSTSACSEATPASPLTIYGLSKLASEQTLAIYHQLKGLDYVCLRLFNVYGPRQNPQHPHANVACKFIAAAANGGQVRLHGDGKQARDFVYIDDVVQALRLVARASRQRIYNVGSGEETSIRALLSAVERASRRTLHVEPCAAWLNDVRTIRADISQLAQEFDYRPAVSLTQGIARTLRFFGCDQSST